MERVPAVALEIVTLRRVAHDENVELTIVEGRTDGVYTWAAVCASSCEKAKAGTRGAELVEQAAAGRGKLGNCRLELLPRDCHVQDSSGQPSNGSALSCRPPRENHRGFSAGRR